MGKFGTNDLPWHADVAAMKRVVLCPEAIHRPEGEKKGGPRYEGQSGAPSVSRRIRSPMESGGSKCWLVGAKTDLLMCANPQMGGTGAVRRRVMVKTCCKPRMCAIVSTTL